MLLLLAWLPALSFTGHWGGASGAPFRAVDPATLTAEALPHLHPPGLAPGHHAPASADTASPADTHAAHAAHGHGGSLLGAASMPLLAPADVTLPLPPALPSLATGEPDRLAPLTALPPPLPPPR